jgi:DNA primase
MAVFSEATRERIRAASDIVDIIGSYVPLKRAGANFTALCPFHKEKTPSFNVNPHKQIFHCFGCHKGGDVFTFVQEYENIGFPDAVRRLAERAKIPIELDSAPGEQQARHLKDQLLEIHEKITQRWQSCLQNEAAGQLARDYLKKRGVSDEAIKLFRIGAAPESWDDTVNWAKSKNFDLALVEKTGLIIKKEETGNYYDRFRGRLMFPICDEQGRVVAFSGRVLSGDEKTAKYVNSPETPIFTKSKIFYGLDKSKRAILDAGFAIICEGQLDSIACFMAGVQNIVAPQGTAFTDQHARILKRYVNEAVLCFDSDEAGQNAAIRSLDYLLASGMAVRVAVVPAPHDPDSYIKSFGGEKFRELINNAKGFFDYYLERLCKQNDWRTDKGRLTIVRSMAEAVHKTGNAVVIGRYAKETALRIGVLEEAVLTEFQKTPSTVSYVKDEPEEASSLNLGQETLGKLPPQELWLLKFLLRYDQIVPWAVLHLDLRWISQPLIHKIVEARLEAQKDESWRGLATFLDKFSSEERDFITNTTAEGKDMPNPEKQLADIVLKLRNQFLDRQISLVLQKFSMPEITEVERLELMREESRLRKEKLPRLEPKPA